LEFARRLDSREASSEKRRRMDEAGETGVVSKLVKPFNGDIVKVSNNESK